MGPDPTHYRCIKVYIPKTRRERITDTAQIIPKQIPILQASLNDHLRNAANDLVHLLKHRFSLLPHNVPHTIDQAILQIAKLLNTDTITTITPILSPTSHHDAIAK